MQQDIMETAVVKAGTLNLAELQSDRQHRNNNAKDFTGWIPLLSPDNSEALRYKYCFSIANVWFK